MRRLYLGDQDGDVLRPPLLESSANRTGLAPLAFDDLIETALIAALRGRGISLQAVREARRVVAAEVGEHPFARRDILVAGKDIFIRYRSAEANALREAGLRTFVLVTANLSAERTVEIRKKARRRIERAVNEDAPFICRVGKDGPVKRVS